MSNDFLDSEARVREAKSHVQETRRDPERGEELFVPKRARPELAMECHYCGERAVGAVSEWVDLEGDLFSRRLPSCPLCSGLRRRALKLDDDWRRSDASLSLRGPALRQALDLQTRSKR